MSTYASESDLLSSSSPTGHIAITGASHGLGLGAACLLASLDHDLLLIARNSHQLLRVRQLLETSTCRVLTAPTDVTDETRMSEAFDRAQALGPLRGLLNNAGLLEPIAPVADTDVSEFSRTLQVNVTGVLVGTKTALARRSGESVLRIVNVSSGAATHGYRGWGAYCSSKSAVNLLTEVTALEIPDENFSAVAVAPGVIETSMQRTIRATTEDRFPDVHRFIEMERSGALLHPVEASVALVWLLLDAPVTLSGRFLDVRADEVRLAIESWRTSLGTNLERALERAKDLYSRLER